MTCAYCKKSITANNYISFADKEFCSDVCQLKFYKEEMPNLGGNAISDEDIQNVEQESGDDRKKLIEEIFYKTQNAFDSGSFMKAIRDEADKNSQ